MRLLTDENFNGAILRGLLMRLPSLDVVRVQDVGLMGTDDPIILEWAAKNKRILLTHDASTVTMYAYNRVAKGLYMPGIVEVIATAAMGQVINDLEIFVLCSQPEEYANRVLFIPLS